MYDSMKPDVVPDRPHRAGSRLPTSPSALQNLLAPFDSVPARAFSPQRPKSCSSDSGSSRPRYSDKPPSQQDTQTDAPETGGPGSGMNDEGDDSADDVHLMVAQVPGTSRVGVDVGQRVHPKITVRNAWQFVPFLTKQASNIASSFFSHHLYGPPKKSWGIEMTIFTAIVRDVANYSHLSNISQLRLLMDCGQILPTPKDGIITPVSFKVKKHNLTGFLSKVDQAEDGNRVITGEWVVSKKTWKRMQNQTLARRTRTQSENNSYGFSRHPSRDSSETPEAHGLGDDKVIYYIHGGAFFVMSASTHRPFTISIAKYTECRLFAINYRLAPETKFPGPLHDVVVGYFRLLNDLKIPAQNIVFAGDSAGGGLVLALLLYLRDEGYPLPSAAMVFSPWCDLTLSCDSWETNRPYDFLPMPKPDDPLNPVKCYLGEEGVKKWITHPYVSPLFGELSNLPPLLIQAGDAEVLRDEVTLFAHKASLHGVKVIHEIYEDCVHCFQFFSFLESSRKALQSMRSYIRHVLPKLESQVDVPVGPVHSTEPVDTPSDGASSPGDPNQGPVDQEISRDAHLVDEHNQAVPKTLPPTPAVPRLSGQGDASSDADEVLSAPEEEQSHEQVIKQDIPTEGPMAPSDACGLAQQRVPCSERLKSPKSHGLSLRGRLPSAIDFETINLILSSHGQTDPLQCESSAEAAQASVVDSPIRRMNSLARMSASLVEFPNGVEQTKETEPMKKVNTNNSHTSRSSGIRYTASQSSLLTPMIKAQQGDSHPDLKAIVNELIETPSELKTTIYRQSQDDEEDEDEKDEYFNKSDEHSTSSLPVAEYAFQTPGYGFS